MGGEGGRWRQKFLPRLKEDRFFERCGEKRKIFGSVENVWRQFVMDYREKELTRKIYYFIKNRYPMFLFFPARFYPFISRASPFVPVQDNNSFQTEVETT